MLDSQTSPQDLAQMLGTTYGKLMFTLYGGDISRFYEEFEISKSNGETRKICAPDVRLKTIQRRLKILLEEIYHPHDAASAFVKGRGILYNARQHVRKEGVLNLDLENFFDQIHFGRVQGLLRSNPYALQKQTARIIAHICCLHGKIPQGSPSSPILSNMICRKLDRELSYLAKQNRARYTRYADDITFSFQEYKKNGVCKLRYPLFPIRGTIKRLLGKTDKSSTPTVKLGNNLQNIIQKNGFHVNEAKTRFQFNWTRQTVTGLKVNKKVNVDRRYVRTTRAMIHSMESGKALSQFKCDAIYGKDTVSIEKMVHGRISFIGMVKGIESPVYQKLAKRFNNTYAINKLNLQPKTYNPDLERLLHFSGYSQRAHLNQCVWVLCFDGLGSKGIDELIQGTAFMITGQRMLTAAHIFEKANSKSECMLYRVNEPTIRYRAKIKPNTLHGDVVELEFDEEEEEIPQFPCLEIADDLDLVPGYMLSMVGFPELHPGHHSVQIRVCRLVNNVVISKIKHGETDAPVKAGNSGGPILNTYMKVVGMARMGEKQSIDLMTSEVLGRWE